MYISKKKRKKKKTSDNGSEFYIELQSFLNRLFNAQRCTKEMPFIYSEAKRKKMLHIHRNCMIKERKYCENYVNLHAAINCLCWSHNHPYRNALITSLWIRYGTFSLKLYEIWGNTDVSRWNKQTLPAEVFTGNGWLWPFKAFAAFSSPSPVMWLAEMSSSRSRGMVMVVATSSESRLSWRRLPDIRSSVRLAWSFKARSRGFREAGAKLRPHTDTEELPSCTSHSLVTRLFSSMGTRRRLALWGSVEMCARLSHLCVLLTHCQALTGFLVTFRERGEIPGAYLSQNLQHASMLLFSSKKNIKKNNLHTICFFFFVCFFKISVVRLDSLPH